MKNWILSIALAVAVCAVSFGAFYAINREPAALRQAAREGDAMQWLRAEFKLSDDQFAAIKQLHDQYAAVCNEHCAAIMAAERRHASADEVAALEVTCVRSMTEHFHRVASLMAPGEGERYLAMVLPRVQDYDHRGAPNLQGR